MNACLRCSPRQGKSEAAKRLVFSRRWDSFGSRNQPPLRENALLAGVPEDVATSHPLSKRKLPTYRPYAPDRDAPHTCEIIQRKALIANVVTIPCSPAHKAATHRAHREHAKEERV